VALEDAAALSGRAAGPAGLRLRFDEVMAAPALAARAAAAAGPGVTVRDWTQEHAAYFRAIRIEKTMMSLILLLVVAVAAFNIVAALVMVVNEKRSDIAILRTLGLARAGVVGAFFTQGVVIGAIGTLIGVGLGVLVARLQEAAQAAKDADERTRGYKESLLGLEGAALRAALGADVRQAVQSLPTEVRQALVKAGGTIPVLLDIIETGDKDALDEIIRRLQVAEGFTDRVGREIGNIVTGKTLPEPGKLLRKIPGLDRIPLPFGEPEQVRGVQEVIDLFGEFSTAYNEALGEDELRKAEDFALKIQASFSLIPDRLDEAGAASGRFRLNFGQTTDLVNRLFFDLGQNGVRFAGNLTEKARELALTFAGNPDSAKEKLKEFGEELKTAARTKLTNLEANLSLINELLGRAKTAASEAREALTQYLRGPEAAANDVKGAVNNAIIEVDRLSQSLASILEGAGIDGLDKRGTANLEQLLAGADQRFQQLAGELFDLGVITNREDLFDAFRPITEVADEIGGESGQKIKDQILEFLGRIKNDGDFDNLITKIFDERANVQQYEQIKMTIEDDIIVAKFDLELVDGAIDRIINRVIAELEGRVTPTTADQAFGNAVFGPNALALAQPTPPPPLNTPDGRNAVIRTDGVYIENQIFYEVNDGQDAARNITLALGSAGGGGTSSTRL
jgi:hypothetical protein